MRPTASDITVLLQRSARGDRAAFAQVYKATSRKLFGIILRILKRPELAEEVLQEVYYRIWQGASRFDPAQASPITWMSVIARNGALDVLRRRELDMTGDSSDAEMVRDESRLPLEALEMSEELRRLEACLDTLDENRREAIKLAYLDGYSRKELAARLNQPVGTIMTWLHRGLKQLKDCLGS